MNENPLVSVVVITYNSANTVLETLDSIAAQTYKNIELIISDDCSTDDTVNKCNNWLKDHIEKFVRVLIIPGEKNIGVSANFNRGFDHCRAEYMKCIAGDDLLEVECIEEYVRYVLANPESIIVFSKVRIFGTNRDVRTFVNPFLYNFFDLSLNEQLDHLINKSNCIPAPTSFINISKIKALGIRADERIPMLEDYPMWINMLKAGIQFHFVDKELVRYRVGGNGLSTGSNRYLMNDSRRLFKLIYIIPNKYPLYDDAALYIFETEKIMVNRILNTKEYKLGNIILKPLKRIKRFMLRKSIKG